MSAYWAPGRVNLIGEHTDYNLGFVLPIALDLRTEANWERKDRQDNIGFASEGRETKWISVDDLATMKPERDWTDYPIGVAQQLMKLGLGIRPKLYMFTSTVPEGAGLSSSAALEVSSALVMLDGRAMDPLELAKLCQRAEREFVGVPSGIMDQYVSVFGRRGRAVMIDCRSLSHEYVPIPENVEIWAVNSMVKHALGNSAYRQRVEECATAADAMGVASLRDATLTKLESTPMPNVILRRARHIVTENDRVQLFVTAARGGNLARMGKLFYESHVSMQHDYEISCEEIDFLVQTAIGFDGCYGARMTGGGFGGCTVNLLRPGSIDRFREITTEVYRERFRLTPEFIRCNPSDGAITSLSETSPSPSLLPTASADLG